MIIFRFINLLMGRRNLINRFSDPVFITNCTRWLHHYIFGCWATIDPDIKISKGFDSDITIFYSESGISRRIFIYVQQYEETPDALIQRVEQKWERYCYGCTPNEKNTTYCVAWFIHSHVADDFGIRDRYGRPRNIPIWTVCRKAVEGNRA